MGQIRPPRESREGLPRLPHKLAEQLLGLAIASENKYVGPPFV